MKKSRRLFVVMSLLVCVAFLVAGSVAPAAAKGAKAKGAVKMDLNQTIPSNGKVGWAIANTTADGRLVIQIHLDDAAPGETFTVFVKVDSLANYDPSGVGELTTNMRGNGNAHVVLVLEDYLLAGYTGDTIDVQVVVKKDSTYRYATVWPESVPLK